MLPEMKNLIDKIFTIYSNSEGVSTDTRQILQNKLFFTLKGDRYDANEWVEVALQKGAAHVVMDNAVLYEQLKDKDKVTLVPDALSTMQALALFHRRQIDTIIFAIGGSNGKTTTKELLKRVLSAQYACYATPGNLNNHIGLPLTLLNMPKETEIAVLELGTNQPGDMHQLIRICEPDMGLTTNIGKEHLELLGSIEGVAREESELYLFLAQNNRLTFVNTDDPWLIQMSSRLSRVVTYGTDTENQVWGNASANHAGLLIQMDNGYSVQTPLIGAYNLHNVLAAWAVGRHFNVHESKIALAIEAYQPDNKRSQLLKTTHYQFYLDCYNANPSSMRVALESFANIQIEHKLVLLGDMLELGEHSAFEHQQIVDLLISLGFKQVLLCGPEFSNLKSPFPCFENAVSLAQFLQQNPPIKGSAIFLKASRGIAIEKAVEHLLAE